ncbi:MAG: methyltransferase domain-containing protein [Cyanobacteria bacterium J06634_6]
MNKKGGSYRYDEFHTKTQVEELERLYRQASGLLNIEQQIWSSLGIGTGKRVLDVGCGSGVITQELAKRVYPGEVTGIDISQELIERSERAYTIGLQHPDNPETEDLYRNVEFQQGEVTSLPFPEATFDFVYARLLFQHLSNPIEALSSIHRVLKPGGLLCVLDVDKAWTGMYPEPESSPALEQALIKKQIAQGGDPWVGRKLGHYLKSTNFSQVKTDISIVDSDRLGLANFFGMLSFGKSFQDGECELADLTAQARLDVQQLINNSDVWSGFALFTVTGRKKVAA